jgi:1-phosphofructokinase
MIVTLTMNPALDRTVSLPAPLEVGEVQAASAIREDAAGKGVNVARVLAAAGDAVTAVLPLAPTDPYAAALSAAGAQLPPRFGAPGPDTTPIDGTRVSVVAVPVAGHARANLAITDPAGETTKLNLPGPELSADTGAALIDAVVEASDGAEWLALCGSLPPGAGDDFYVRVIEAVRSRTANPPLIAVDTSGSALVATVAAGHPDLIKPNEIELAELAGVSVRSEPAAVAEIARALVPAQAGSALITLGGDGAVLVTAGGAVHATIPPNIAVRSTVGAGDSSLAGYLHARGAGLDEGAALDAAVRHGSATASLPGTRLATPADLPQGEVALTTL